MLDLISSVDDLEFEMEVALEEQRGIQPLPFPNMDKSSASVCKFYGRGMCNRDQSCPYRHTSGPKTVVCKHWLRGLCKKGDGCEYLHEYDMTKMPECYFFSKYGECSNKECQYLHIDPNTRMKDCPWFDRGFCKHGPQCRNRHVRRVMCTNYMSGFCPLGPKCKSMHPRFELPKQDVASSTVRRCHRCNEPGHISTNCPVRQPVENLVTTYPVQSDGQGTGMLQTNPATGDAFVPKPLELVTCFKCGEKGHYANRCALSKKNLNLSNSVGIKIVKS